MESERLGVVGWGWGGCLGIGEGILSPRAETSVLRNLAHFFSWGDLKLLLEVEEE